MSMPKNVTELLQALVRLPSVNPAGNPGTTGIGEERCAEYIRDYLAAIGAEARLVEVLPGRPNVIGHFPGRPGRPRLLLAPHTDTVSVAGMTIDPFGGELREGKVWGRGASDTKGSIAAMLQALAEIGAEALAAAPYEIWFAGLVGEEAGQQGARALAATEEFAFVIAGEPTGMNVVHTHKGSSMLRLVTRGKAVHASQPDSGRNAIYAMAALIAVLEKEIAPSLQRFSHPLLGHSTLSVGTIEGGSKTNIVPDLCVATVDLRTVPGQMDTPDFLSGLEERLREVCPDLEMEAHPTMPLQTDPEHPLIRQLDALGSRGVGAPWFCDAAIFAHRGTPAIAMGPGSIAQAHTEDEWITVADLEFGVRRFGEFLRSLAG